MPKNLQPGTETDTSTPTGVPQERQTVETIEKIVDTAKDFVQDQPEEVLEKKHKRRRAFYKHKDVNNGQQSFASGINIYKILWVFIFGCVFGVVFETLYVFSQTGVWMRRSGMLYGPFNQVYGLGAVLFTLLLYRYRKKNSFVIFLAAGVTGLIFEYVCSWVQELIFGSVSWEYSGYATNIGGRTNLLYGVGWGLLGMLFITHFWPWASEMIERIPNTVGKPLTIVVSVLLALNLALSGAAVFRQNQRLHNVPANTAIARWLDNTYPDDVMAEKYPSMQFVDQEDTGGQEQEERGPSQGE